MKKAVIILLLFVMMFSFVSCGIIELNGNNSEIVNNSQESSKNDTQVREAIKNLKDKWRDIYNEELKDRDYNHDGYFEIKNTRVINIKNNTIEEFKDVSCIVEFILYTDYFFSAPYYEDAGTYNSVTIYKDNTMEVNSGNPMRRYRSKHYTSDFSEFIESIEDYHDKYNQIVNLK